MPLRIDFTGFLRTLFPEAGASLLALHAGAAENAGLLRSDFYTLRDLLDLSGYAGAEPLHVLLLALLLALDEGSLCVDATETGLTRRLAGLVDDVGPLARQAAEGLQACGYPDLIGQRVEDGKPVVLQTHGGRPYLYFQKFLRHERVLHAELRRRLAMCAAIVDPAQLRSALTEVLADTSVALSRDQRRALVTALLRNFAVISGGPGTGKTSIVRTLLRCLLRCGYTAERIVLAAPTGRAAQRLTDSTRSGLDRLPLMGPDAALRDLSAATLHHLLGYNPSRGTFRHHVENPLPADVVIVDEMSMVGLTLMAQLLQATEPAAKLILLGDKDQLPSVEAGAVLANLIPAEYQPACSAAFAAQIAMVCPDLASCDSLASRRGSPPKPAPGGPDGTGLLQEVESVCKEPVAPGPPGAGLGGDPLPLAALQDVLVVLEQNYRSQRDILEIAQAVNRQDPAIVDRLRRFNATSCAGLDEQPGCWLLDQETLTPAEWRQLLVQWLEHHYLTAPSGSETYRGLVEACELPSDGGIPAGQKSALDRLFTLLQQARVLTLVREGPWGCAGVNQFLDQTLRLRLDRAARGTLFLGAPVLVTRNDYQRQLFNGDVGVTLRNDRGAYRVVFPRQDGYVSFAAEALPCHELAFALTVHKSQGSEYGQVLLVLPSEGGRRLLTKEMIYTGITRARQAVVICARPDVLRTAITRRIERESALLTLTEE